MFKHYCLEGNWPNCSLFCAKVNISRSFRETPTEINIPNWTKLLFRGNRSILMLRKGIKTSKWENYQICVRWILMAPSKQFLQNAWCFLDMCQEMLEFEGRKQFSMNALFLLSCLKWWNIIKWLYWLISPVKKYTILCVLCLWGFW